MFRVGVAGAVIYGACIVVNLGVENVKPLVVVVVSTVDMLGVI